MYARFRQSERRPDTICGNGRKNAQRLKPGQTLLTDGAAAVDDRTLLVLKVR
jgi:hypothetical protein